MKIVEGEEILATAAREIGYHEGPGKKNKYGEWFGMNGVAWCMEFVQYIYHQCGLDLPLHTPSCSGLLNWYKRNQPECVTTEPIRGCIVIFDWPGTQYSTDHTGLFVSKTDKKITTIDGNTGDGNDSNGGGVQQKSRNLSYANPIYIIPRGLVTVDIGKLIDDMTDEQAYKLYNKAVKHMATLPLPTTWDAAGELREAKDLGITDGSNPMCPATRLQTAVMVKRAVRKK